MKQFIYLSIVLLLTACNTGNQKDRLILTNITGELNDVLVVMEKENWDNESGKSLKSILIEPYYGLPQYESSLKAIQIEHSGFSNMFQLYRNIIDVTISNKVEQSKIWYGKDVYARPQAFLKIEAKNGLEFMSMLNKNAQAILDFFKNAEIERLQSSYKNHSSDDIVKHLIKKFGIKVDVPANYKLEVDSNQFSWIAFETPEMSQGIFVYSYNYKDTSQFNKQNLLIQKNYFLKRFVPGPKEGSYMTTEDEYPVKMDSKINANGLFSVTMEGLWKTEGDFMGGPFVSYIFPDKNNEKIICIDAYVYCPKKDKRNFIMQLEAIIKTARYQ